MTRRVLVTAIAVCAIGVTVLIVPAALAVRSRDRLVDVLELQRRAAVAARRLPPPPPDPGGLAALPDLGDHEADHDYAVYGPSGRLITGTGPATADRAVTAALRGTDAVATVDGQLAVAAPLGPPSAITGAVRAAEPLAESTERTRATILRLATASAVSVGVAGAAGWLLVRRILRPLRAVRYAAHRLGDGDFTVTVEPSGMAELDEVGHALAAAGQRIGRLVQRERAFSADASHALRTPIAALRTALEAELLAARPDPRLIVTEGLAAVDRLDATVEDLLRLARDVPADRGPLDVTEWPSGPPASGDPGCGAAGGSCI